jgi:hypothetical protein
VVVLVARDADIVCDMLFKIKGSVDKDLVKSFSLEIGGCELVKITDKSKFIFKNDPDGKHFWAGSTSTSYPIPIITLQYHEVRFSIELNDSSKLDKIVGNRSAHVYLDRPKRQTMARERHLFGPNKMIYTKNGMAGMGEIYVKEEKDFFDLESFPTIFMHKKKEDILESQIK